MNFKKLGIVIEREYLNKVKKKSFLLITFLTPVLFAGIAILPSLIMMGTKEAAKQVDRQKQYDPEEAIALVKKIAYAGFDETVEVHIRTGCDGRHADQRERD